MTDKSKRRGGEESQVKIKEVQTECKFKKIGFNCRIALVIGWGWGFLMIWEFSGLFRICSLRECYYYVHAM